MTVLFNQHITGTGLPEMASVAALDCTHTLTQEAASSSTLKTALAVLKHKKIDRVEFIQHPGTRGRREFRGAVFYASHHTLQAEPNPYLHVVHALLGYEGSGPSLSRWIMEHLGMTEAMFNDMNGSVRTLRAKNYSYVVCATRDQHGWSWTLPSPEEVAQIAQ